MIYMRFIAWYYLLEYEVSRAMALVVRFMGKDVDTLHPFICADCGFRTLSYERRLFHRMRLNHQFYE